MDNRYDFVNFFLSPGSELYTANDVRKYLKRFSIKEISQASISVSDFLSSESRLKSLLFFKSRVKKKLVGSEFDEYFVFPNLDNPRWFILNNRKVIANHGLIIKPTTVKSRFVWNIAKILNKLNIFGLLFPYRLLVPRVLADQFKNKFNLRPETINGIIYTGAPGKYQKFTCQLYDKFYRIEKYIKLGTREAAIQRVERETKELNRINSKKLSNVVVPNVLGFYSGDLFTGLVSDNILELNGQPRLFFSKQDSNFIIQMFNSFGSKKISVKEFYSSFGYIETVEHFFQRRGIRSIKLMYSHGDYIAWNRFINKNENRVIDWEVAGYRPLFYDLVFFIFYNSYLGKKGVSASHFTSKCKKEISNIISTVKYKLSSEKEIYVYFIICLYLIANHISLNSGQIDKVMVGKAIEIAKGIEIIYLNET